MLIVMILPKDLSDCLFNRNKYIYPKGLTLGFGIKSMLCIGCGLCYLTYKLLHLGTTKIER